MLECVERRREREGGGLEQRIKDHSKTHTISLTRTHTRTFNRSLTFFISTLSLTHHPLHVQAADPSSIFCRKKLKLKLKLNCNSNRVERWTEFQSALFTHFKEKRFKSKRQVEKKGIN
jgi:hypothetical protein